MESVENDIVAQTETTSALSDWVGAPVDFNDVQYVEGIREGDDKVVADKLEIFDRVYDLIRLSANAPYIEYGPSSSPMLQYPLDVYLKDDKNIQAALLLYDGLAYDEVEFRISLSNPKGISGGLLVGVYPFQNWYGASFDASVGFDNTNLMTRQRLFLSPDCHLMTYSEAKDLVITVPWQRNVPFMNWTYLQEVRRDNSTRMPMPGCPVIWVCGLAANYVSTVTMLARLRIYFKFKNLRCISPIDTTTAGAALERASKFKMQSGVEVAAFAAGAAVVDAALLAGSEIIKDILSPHQSTFDEGSYKDGSYEAPGAVQMAYVGDSTSIGPPPTTPIFRNALPGMATRHSVLDMIKEPQFLETITANNTLQQYYANPTAPIGGQNLEGPTQLCSYLRWFSQFVQFWRGTINFHFVILGHPMVEIGYSMRIGYPDLGSTDPGDEMSMNTQMKGIVSGVHHIKVPMPNQNIRDHFQVIDKCSTSTANIALMSASTLFVSFDVVSTMLDVEPTISVAVFYSAGEDFEFLQPQAIGFADVVNADTTKFEMQVNLDPPTEVFATRARTQKSLNQLVPLHYVEDFMEIWSRALPYGDYDNNDEPIVDLIPGCRPVWWPMSGGSASHTLDVNNSWWVTNDYVSLLSSMYLFYKGSIAFKILCDPSGTGYKFVSLRDNNSFRQPTNNPFTYSSTNLPPSANFGFGTVITPSAQQPVMDMTIPYRGVLPWGLTNPYTWATVYMQSGTLGFASVETNVVLHTAGSSLKDALYRKKGVDYAIAVRGLLPPATLWVAKGFDWTDTLSRRLAVLAPIRGKAGKKVTSTTQPSEREFTE